MFLEYKYNGIDQEDVVSESDKYVMACIKIDKPLTFNEVLIMTKLFHMEKCDFNVIYTYQIY